MSRTTIAALAMLALLVVESGAAVAETVKPAGPVMRPVAPLWRMEPLSPKQCVGAGGKVIDASKCVTGKNCVVVDVNGVIHSRCINELDPN